VYGFAFCAPLVIWFVFKQYDAALQFVAVLCLYGYSLAVFLPAVVSCRARLTECCRLVRAAVLLCLPVH
jgi:hypothetical protein